MGVQYEAFSASAISAIRHHPDFVRVLRQRAAESLAEYKGLDDHGRWQVSDLGRAALTGAAVIMDALGTLTADQLIEAAATRQVCSRGRVLSYLNRAQQSGLIGVPAGAGPWTRRPLLLTPRFQAPVAAYVRVQMRAAARLAPHLKPCIEALTGPEVLRRFVAMIGLLTTSRPDVFEGPSPIILFMGRDGGMRVLDQLIARQPDDAIGLLEPLTVSNAGLAHPAYVSRTHVKRLIADGVAMGSLRREGRRLEFSTELIEGVEQYHAVMFELFRVTAEAIRL